MAIDVTQQNAQPSIPDGYISVPEACEYLAEHIGFTNVKGEAIVPGYVVYDPMRREAFASTTFINARGNEQRVPEEASFKVWAAQYIAEHKGDKLPSQTYGTGTPTPRVKSENGTNGTVKSVLPKSKRTSDYDAAEKRLRIAEQKLANTNKTINDMYVSLRDLEASLPHLRAAIAQAQEELDATMIEEEDTLAAQLQALQEKMARIQRAKELKASQESAIKE